MGVVYSKLLGKQESGNALRYPLSSRQSDRHKTASIIVISTLVFQVNHYLMRTLREKSLRSSDRKTSKPPFRLKASARSWGEATALEWTEVSIASSGLPVFY